jgi:hypothetical protein
MATRTLIVSETELRNQKHLQVLCLSEVFDAAIFFHYR